MKLWDRLLIVAYLKAYLFCLASLLSLYVIIDLFTNVEDFVNASSGAGDMLLHIFSYYAYRTAPIFDRLSEAVVLMAAMFTVAWMQRNNELLPLLSAGVSTRRVVQPVLVSAGLMLGLSAVNTEIIIPRITDELAYDRDDPRGDKDLIVRGAYEPNGIHLEGSAGSRRMLAVRPFNVSIPETLSPGLLHLKAQEARYVPPQPDERLSGGWLLLDTEPPNLEKDAWNNTEILEWIDPGKYFLHTQEVQFDTLTRNNRNWYMLLSTRQLHIELRKPDSARLAAMAVQFHIRMTRPVLGLLLVFLGLAVILRDQNRNVFISAGLCLAMSALFFAAIFTCKWLGENGYLGPALAAWMPVIFFGPIALVLFDAVHT